MPATYTDQFYLVDPAIPMPDGTVLTVVKFDLVDSNDDGLIRGTGFDSLDGQDITHVWVGDRVTMDFGSGPVEVNGVTFYLADGRPLFTPIDGTVLQDGTLLSSHYVTKSSQIAVGALGPPCFVAGTRIATPDGPRPVEALRVGDLVLTADHGPQPLRWVGGKTVLARGKQAPVRFASGVLGNDRPLLVSPQHRIVLSGWHVELLFGTDEVLAPALHLVDGRGVTRPACVMASYHHLLFDRHEVVFAEGTATESLFAGDYCLAANPALAGVVKDAGITRQTTARRVLRGHEASVLWRSITATQELAAAVGIKAA